MPGVSPCLRRSFAAFNVFFAIIGALIIVLTFQHQVLHSFHKEENVSFEINGLFIIGIITMVVAILGAYGAYKESKLCLSLFLGCMVSGIVLMLIYGIPAAIARTKVEKEFENELRSFLPLNKAPEHIKNMANTIQTEMHCCGLFSYTDWENNIPESCMCSPTEEDTCRTVSYQDAFFMRSVSVYSKTCYPSIANNFQLIIKIIIGIIFTLASIALLSMILTSVIIHQMRRTIKPTIVFRIPTTFIPPPPKYEKLHDTPPTYC